MAKAPVYEGLTASMPFDRAARIVLGTLLETSLAYAPAVLRGEDVEAVHDMRVSLRRLRTALRTFRRSFPRRRLAPHRKAAGRLARALGEMRDADVHLASLRAALGGATSEEAAGIGYALETIVGRRRESLAAFAIELSQFERDRFKELFTDG